MADLEKTRNLVASWRAMNERMAAIIGDLDDEALAEQSYAAEWSVTKVISHMGSGTEIFSRFLDAATGRGEAPTQDQFQEFWAEWDARSPRETAIAWRERTAELLAQVGGYDDDTLTAASLDLFGRERDVFDIALMRLSEDLLHGWDIAVAFDDQAELDPVGVPWVLDMLGEMVGYAGKAVEPLSVTVRTTDPDRELDLVVAEHVSLTPAGAGAGESAGESVEAALDLPAAAFIRLVYGRMDPAHTPEGVQVTGVDLDTLRATFPGL